MKKIDVAEFIKCENAKGNSVRCLLFDYEKGGFHDASAQEIARHARVTSNRIYRNDGDNSIVLLERDVIIKREFFQER